MANQLAKNKAVGKQGEEIVKSQLQKELQDGETLLEQATFKMDNGKRSRPDFTIMDANDNVKKTVEAKTGNSPLSTNQKTLQQQGGKLTGKKAGKFQGAQAKPNTLEERSVEIDN